MNKTSNQALKPYKSQQGFVLVLTLSMIAIALLASSYIAKWIDDQVEEYNKTTQPLQQRLDRYSTLSTIIYITATHPMTFAGFAFPPRQNAGYGFQVNEDGDPDLAMQGNELRIDDRLYRGVGSSLFQIQDEGGLISVNTLSESRLKTLFAFMDIDQRFIPGALAKLNDYIDQDNEYRPDGAEAKQYRIKRRTGPANLRLRTPEELALVLGWRSIMSDKYFNKISTFMTTTPVVSININSAPRESLLVVGLTPQEADNIITFRENEAISFSNISSLIDASNTTLDLDIFQYYASRSLRVTILSGMSGRVEEYHLELTTHIEESKPWYIRYKKTQSLTVNNNMDKALATGKALFSEH